jgi:hypothetical protein
VRQLKDEENVAVIEAIVCGAARVRVALSDPPTRLPTSQDEAKPNPATVSNVAVMRLTQSSFQDQATSLK